MVQKISLNSRSTDLSDAFVETARKCRSTWVIPAGTSYIHSCNGSEERSHLAGLFAKIAGAPGKCICTFDSITVQGSLKIENEETTNITYRTRMMLIDGGEFIAGESEQDPFKGKLELVLTGKSADQVGIHSIRLMVLRTVPPVQQERQEQQTRFTVTVSARA